MRLNGLAITVLALLLNHQSPIIYDYNPRLTSIMAVYLYIVRVEETIKTCSRADQAAASYDKCMTYDNKMAREYRLDFWSVKKLALKVLIKGRC